MNYVLRIWAFEHVLLCLRYHSMCYCVYFGQFLSLSSTFLRWTESIPKKENTSWRHLLILHQWSEVTIKYLMWPSVLTHCRRISQSKNRGKTKVFEKLLNCSRKVATFRIERDSMQFPWNELKTMVFHKKKMIICFCLAYGMNRYKILIGIAYASWSLKTSQMRGKSLFLPTEQLSTSIAMLEIVILEL